MRGARLVHKLAGIGLGDPNQAQLRAEQQRLVHGRAGAVDVKLLDVGGDAAEGLVHLGVPVYCDAAPHQPACARAAMRQTMASRARQDLHTPRVFYTHASLTSSLNGKCRSTKEAKALLMQVAQICQCQLSSSAAAARTRLAARQDVHERGLARARHAHEAGEAARAEGAADVVQQGQLRP